MLYLKARQCRAFNIYSTEHKFLIEMESMHKDANFGKSEINGSDYKLIYHY